MNIASLALVETLRTDEMTVLEFAFLGAMIFKIK
jgi:hypothetical protein